MKILKLYTSYENHENQFEINDNNENHTIPFENYEHHWNPKVQFENSTNYENLRILERRKKIMKIYNPMREWKNNENFKIKCKHNEFIKILNFIRDAWKP